MYIVGTSLASRICRNGSSHHYSKFCLRFYATGRNHLVVKNSLFWIPGHFQMQKTIFDAPKSSDFFINFDFANEIESGWARTGFEEVKDKKLIFLLGTKHSTGGILVWCSRA